MFHQASLEENEAFSNEAAWSVIGPYLASFIDLAKSEGMPPKLIGYAERAAPAAPPQHNVKSIVLGDLWPNSVHFDPQNR